MLDGAVLGRQIESRKKYLQAQHLKYKFTALAINFKPL